STRDSDLLAKYAGSLGYDALSAIPPIYFVLSGSSIKVYWTSIIESRSLTFIIYNIPQTIGYSLSADLCTGMIENRKGIGLKNSTMAVMDIEIFRRIAGDDFIIFNGPDEQFVSGRLIGADSGIGGTYASMPELLSKANEFVSSGDFAKAKEIQADINDIIVMLNGLNGHMYDVIKKVLQARKVTIGSVRAPMSEVTGADLQQIEVIKEHIDKTIQKYTN